ncbi:hypothetical protein [Rhizobium sp. MHM7A]|uniref:hypothetical protein n=1 Tax=Rhizobium sp. MHM7A TaxID=2583233 RepID=UPI001106547C|nr:hypothetical protein [Rhizobium sp. MHM7A]TLX16138.1 hypothetical protein FFR93_02095 [Rhizobium sp. MHM7A]
MPSIEEISLVSKTIRFQLTDKASSLAGHGTPYPMAPAENKIAAQKGVSEVEVRRWGEPFVIDVTIDSELAADHNWTVEQVEDHVRTLLNNHCSDFARLTKFTRESGIYPHHERLIVSDDEYIVLQNRNDKTFTVCYENGADITRAKVENDDALAETLQEIVDETAHDPTFVSRGNLHVEQWTSRHRRGIVWR